MPIRPELRWFYPIDWPQISAAVRFGRAKGRCERCARPHGGTLRQLPDRRWYDSAGGCWRDDRGREAAWPDIIEYTRVRVWRVSLAAAHLDHDPGNCRPRNLQALCQRCHLMHDRPEHVRRRRFAYLRRRALGDLFGGAYPIVPPLRPLRVGHGDRPARAWRIRPLPSPNPAPAPAALPELLEFELAAPLP